MKKSDLISPAEYARQRGLSKSTVSRQIRDGKIPMRDGMVDPREADKARRLNLDHRKRHRRPEPQPKERASAQPAPAPRGDKEPAPISLVEAQIKHEIAKASKTGLEAAKLRGILVDAEEMAQAWSRQIVSAREHILQLPSKLAPKVAVESDVLACQFLIEREVRSLLTELSEYQPNAA